MKQGRLLSAYIAIALIVAIGIPSVQVLRCVNHYGKPRQMGKDTDVLCIASVENWKSKSGVPMRIIQLRKFNTRAASGIMIAHLIVSGMSS